MYCVLLFVQSTELDGKLGLKINLLLLFITINFFKGTISLLKFCSIVLYAIVLYAVSISPQRVKQGWLQIENMQGYAFICFKKSIGNHNGIHILWMALYSHCKRQQLYTFLARVVLHVYTGKNTLISLYNKGTVVTVSRALILPTPCPNPPGPCYMLAVLIPPPPPPPPPLITRPCFCQFQKQIFEMYKILLKIAYFLLIKIFFLPEKSFKDSMHC